MILDNWQHSDYKVIKHITNGGSSKIFLIELKDGSKAILKLAIAPLYINNKQITNEAYLIGKLKHPSIPKLIDTVEINGYRGIVMSLMRGRNLKHVIDTKIKSYTWVEILNIARQLANIMNYFHKQEPYIVIRDIKPSNIVIDNKLNVQLVDFGTSTDNTSSIHNKAFGTVGYAAPEQFENGNVHRRSDIYSFGATIFYILSNGKIIDEQKKVKMNKNIPKSMMEFVYKATNENINLRYQNTKELIDALENIDYTTWEKIKKVFRKY